jgi:putative protein-disulfide isomerase
MGKTVYYLFDPLCGWCYGATPVVSGLQKSLDFSLTLLPTGLFSADGARLMDDAFAAYAWSNDQRIERLSGQRFSARYHQRVLGNRQQLFDSGPATLALTAVSLTDPAREPEALKAIQQARYVEGNDVTSLTELSSVLTSLEPNDAAARFAHPDVALHNASQARLDRAHKLMREFDVSGVPTFIAEVGATRWVLDHASAYANEHAVLTQLEAS